MHSGTEADNSRLDLIDHKDLKLRNEHLHALTKVFSINHNKVEFPAKVILDERQKLKSK